jgi:hypothetical protein
MFEIQVTEEQCYIFRRITVLQVTEEECYIFRRITVSLEASLSFGMQN